MNRSPVNQDMKENVSAGLKRGHQTNDDISINAGAGIGAGGVVNNTFEEDSSFLELKTPTG